MAVHTRLQLATRKHPRLDAHGLTSTQSVLQRLFLVQNETKKLSKTRLFGEGDFLTDIVFTQGDLLHTEYRPAELSPGIEPSSAAYKAATSPAMLR